MTETLTAEKIEAGDYRVGPFRVTAVRSGRDGWVARSRRGLPVGYAGSLAAARRLCTSLADADPDDYDRAALGECFDDYFAVADEVDGGLTLDELDAGTVASARLAADALNLPWWPDLASAEDFALDHETVRERRYADALANLDSAAWRAARTEATR